jgi:hypothetical protein
MKVPEAPVDDLLIVNELHGAESASVPQVKTTLEENATP